MAAAQAYYLVKILSGSHAGAEVRLVTGAYRVGRDDDADVVLEDHALAGEHALVTIEAEGVKVEPLMGAVTVNGAPHAEPARRLPFFAVVGLGATYLAVGPEGSAWPSVASPTPASLAAIADQPAQALVPAQAPAARPRAWARPWLPLLLLPLLLLLLLRPFGQASAPDPPRAPEDPA